MVLDIGMGCLGCSHVDILPTFPRSEGDSPVFTIVIWNKDGITKDIQVRCRKNKRHS